MIGSVHKEQQDYISKITDMDYVLLMVKETPMEMQQHTAVEETDGLGGA